MPTPTDDATASPELALRWEEHDWNPQTPPQMMLRRDRARIGRPYRAAVPPAIATMPFVLDPDVVADAEDARAEITRFDADLGATFPGEFAPLAAVLLRTESTSSSQIEDITAGSRALALAELGLAKHGSNAKLVVANVEAMERAIDLADHITPNAILAVHEALMRGQDHASPGAYRDVQVWIGGHHASPHDAAFVPPHHARVEPAIDDLCEFVHRTDLPLMAHTAVAHAQFETIHPFNDGNGRTGRTLVHAMLKHGNATTRTTVPVSAGLLSDTSTYFDALTAYRAGDPNPIVTRFNEAALAAIVNGRRLAADLHDINDRWRDRLTARRDSVAWRILPILLSQPAVTSKLVQQQTGVSQPAADRALGQLADAGIVQVKNEQGDERRRNVVWRADAVIEALDAFAARARRRPA
ncbi:Fic family protein [Nocardioides nitrophenolicus]|uniref:Fic family protein n=1 Tax=Nocardioides nitrophenolicus TaxID=60489 RepID=UPI00195C20E0|nr:Fic family protein [Nocardioides nitrophenolicus]MBM7516962.1 Fic family protein [Nocardioides nitrophenolicus]